MKNKMSDVRNHLVAMMERLSEEDLSADAVAKEVEKAKALSGLAKEYTSNVKLELDARRLVAEGDIHRNDLPPVLEHRTEQPKLTVAK